MLINLLDHVLKQGLLPGCLAGLQAEWFDRTELESQDRSARLRIETSHVDLQDVGSAKLQLSSSSLHEKRYTNTLDTRARSSEQNDSNDPAQS